MRKRSRNRYLRVILLFLGILEVMERGSAQEAQPSLVPTNPSESPCCYLHEKPVPLKIPRCILVTKEICPEIVPEFRERILQYDQESQKDPIIILVNSLGGDVRAALAMHDLMKMVKAPVVTVGMGVIASAGTLVLSAGRKGDRYLLPHARVMIHQGQSRVYGATQDIFDAGCGYLQCLGSLYKKAVAQNTGQPLEILNYLKKHEHWMGAQEAIDLGFADRVLTVNPFAFSAEEKRRIS